MSRLPPIVKQSNFGLFKTQFVDGLLGEWDSVKIAITSGSEDRVKVARVKIARLTEAPETVTRATDRQTLLKSKGDETGEAYMRGVRDALRWVLGDTEHNPAPTSHGDPAIHEINDLPGGGLDS